MSFSRDETRGLLLAWSAFILWGLIPIYFKALGGVPPLEIIGHRVVWTIVGLGLIYAIAGRWPLLIAAFRRPRIVALLALSGVTIASNWLIFVWAVSANHVMETSLGYFINPLLSVLLGMVVLGERLRMLQWVAVGLATAGVLISIGGYGAVPWVALSLAFSFALYGLLRKQIQIDAMTGLFVETLVILPFALGVLAWIAARGETSFVQGNPELDLLLVLAGPVTFIPLSLFAAGVKRIPLSVLGFLQYTAPTMTFLLAVFVYGEPFAQDRLVTFGFIWAGVLVFLIDSVGSGHRAVRARRTAAQEALALDDAA